MRTIEFHPEGEYFFCFDVLPTRFSQFLKAFGSREVKRGWQIPRLNCVVNTINRLPGTRVQIVDEKSFADPPFEEHFRWKDLYEQQQDAIRHLYRTPLSGTLIQIALRLGKTPTAIVGANLTGAKKCLIICPASLITTWEREISKWSDGSTTFVITSYHSAVLHLEKYRRDRWDLMILDESIMAQNRETKRFKALKQLRIRSKKCWCLSGNPSSKYTDRYWAQLHLCCPSLFSSYWRFVERYCTVVETPPWGREIVGPSSINLVEDLNDVIFCRHHEDVGLTPDIRPEPMYLDLLSPQQKTYDSIVNEFIVQLESGEEMTVPNQMAQLIRCQQAVSNLKNLGLADISAKSDLVESILKDETVLGPILIWVHWNETGKQLAARLSKKHKVGLVLGDTSKPERVLDDFKAGKIDILIMSITIGKFGHTFDMVNTVIYHDRIWDFDSYYQSFYRAWTPARTTPIRVISLIASGTVDEMVNDNLEGKAWSISASTGADLALVLKGIQNANVRRT